MRIRLRPQVEPPNGPSSSQAPRDTISKTPLASSHGTSARERHSDVKASSSYAAKASRDLREGAISPTLNLSHAKGSPKACEPLPSSSTVAPTIHSGWVSVKFHRTYKMTPGLQRFLDLQSQLLVMPAMTATQG